MRTFPDDAVVQLSGCMEIVRLLRGDFAKLSRIVVAAGGVELAAAAGRRHCGNEKVRFYAEEVRQLLRRSGVSLPGEIPRATAAVLTANLPTAPCT
jgi:hypothetical protein